MVDIAKILRTILMILLVTLVIYKSYYQNEINESQIELNQILIDKITSLETSEKSITEIGKRIEIERDISLLFCEDIMVQFNGVTFMKNYLDDEKYIECGFRYDNITIIDGLHPKDISEYHLECLSEYRYDNNIPDWWVIQYNYIEGSFYNGDGYRIEC